MGPSGPVQDCNGTALPLLLLGISSAFENAAGEIHTGHPLKYLSTFIFSNI